MSHTAPRSIAIIGIGNSLAGDDGAGLEVVRRLEPQWGGDPRVLLGQLEGDLYAISDLLPLAEEFLFVDAVASDVPGRQVRGETVPFASAPSLHQTDVAWVMQMLAKLQTTDPFPPWAVWGVTILPPGELHDGLSEPVANAVKILTDDLDGYLREHLRGR